MDRVRKYELKPWMRNREFLTRLYCVGLLCVLPVLLPIAMVSYYWDDIKHVCADAWEATTIVVATAFLPWED